MFLIASQSVPAKNLAELVQQAKARPGGFSVASSGNGSTGHIASEVFASRAGLKMLNIFYKGNAQAIVDVISGQTQLMFDQVSTAMAHVRSGKVRPLAVTSNTRSALFPEVPTIAESGYPGYEDVTLNMLLAPAGTPKEIVQRLHAELVKAYAQPAMVAQFAERGIDLVASASPEEFGQLIRSEVARLGKLANEVGIKAE
jgi:tripartite-type tricarboxylate transporter receptor subunit TctC